MQVTNPRIFQQVRLWIYSALIVLSIAKFLGGHANIIDFVIFMSLGLLAYLEFCPTCRRLSWWETDRWPNVLWIGPTCRRCGSTHCSE